LAQEVIFFDVGTFTQYFGKIHARYPVRFSFTSSLKNRITLTNIHKYLKNHIKIDSKLKQPE